MAQSSTLRDLKQRVQDAEGVPSEQQRLLYNAKLLDDRWTPKDFKQQQGVVHILLNCALAGSGLNWCTMCGIVLTKYVDWDHPFVEEMCHSCVIDRQKATKSQSTQYRKKQRESSESEASDDKDFEEPRKKFKSFKLATTASVAKPAATKGETSRCAAFLNNSNL